MGLNCSGPPVRGFFSIVNPTVLPDPQSAAEAQVQRNRRH